MSVRICETRTQVVGNFDQSFEAIHVLFDVLRVSSLMPAAGRLKLEPMNAQIISCSLSFDDYPIEIFHRSVVSVEKQDGLAECDGGIEL